MYLIAQAMEKVGSTDSTKLRDAIAATKNFAGVTGQTSIDAHRNSEKPAVMIAVRNGTTEFYESVTP